MPHGIFGILFFLFLCWVLSEKRSHINIVGMLKGLAAHITLTVLILTLAPVRSFFEWLGKGVMAVREATITGTTFMFGYLGGGAAPFDIHDPSKMFVFAFQALPMIMVVSALSMLFFHWRIIPIIVKGLSRLFKSTLNIGGALGVCSAGKIFLGQTEAPLLVKPYLAHMSRSEIFTIMCLGLATTSGTIFAIYASLLDHILPNALTHILTASIINIPAAILLARILIPQEGKDTDGSFVVPYHFNSSMDAVSRGISDGLKLFLAILAMLLVFVALVDLANRALSVIPSFDDAPLTLQRIIGYGMAPIAWFMGIPWGECITAGGLLGIKTILNELFAFTTLSGHMGDSLSQSSRVIMTYALCGFANISSIGILIGGLGGMVPEKRDLIIELGFKALLVGTLASCFSGTMVGIVSQFFEAHP